MTKTFGAESTTEEVLDGVDLQGKRILVTGVSAGIGVETARALVAHGADVVGAARDLAKARGATEAVRAAANTGGAVHPGSIRTELSRHLTPEATQKLIAAINETQKLHGGTPHAYKSIPQGAATSVPAATIAPVEEIGGQYCEDCHVAAIQEGEGLRGGVRPYALDPARAKALWAKSEMMVGETF